MIWLFWKQEKDPDYTLEIKLSKQPRKVPERMRQISSPPVHQSLPVSEGYAFLVQLRRFVL